MTTRRKKKQQKKKIIKVCILFVILILAVKLLPSFAQGLKKARIEKIASENGYPKQLQEMLDNNEETVDYVENYKNRDQYKNQSIDISRECKDGEVPLLMQWDKRWGYDAYGDKMIGVAGCGPTCLTMVYLYLTGDYNMNPRKMAEYCYEKGYYTEEGTDWSLWTDGVAGLGLTGKELSLDESSMEQALDQNSLIVCSMGPGDFTTTGHFIVIRGYDQNGFYVNDPNRKSNSDKQWNYEKISSQIRNLWVIR